MKDLVGLNSLNTKFDAPVDDLNFLAHKGFIVLQYFPLPPLMCAASEPRNQRITEGGEDEISVCHFVF